MAERVQDAIEPQRILFVEDHEDTVRVMKTLLMRDGHSVDAASTLRDALQKCAMNKYDLIITDLELPDGFGYDLIKDGSGCHGVKAIVLSGHGMPEHITRSRAAGFVTHLVKPVAYDKLRSAVAMAVSGD